MPRVEKTGFGLAHHGSYSSLPSSVTFEAESCWVLTLDAPSLCGERQVQKPMRQQVWGCTQRSVVTRQSPPPKHKASVARSCRASAFKVTESCNQRPQLHSQHSDFGIQVICLESLYYSSGNFNWRKSLLFPATGPCLGQLITITPALLKMECQRQKLAPLVPEGTLFFFFLTSYPK